MLDKSLRGKVAIVGVADTEVGVLPGRTPMEMGGGGCSGCHCGCRP